MTCCLCRWFCCCCVNERTSSDDDDVLEPLLPDPYTPPGCVVIDGEKPLVRRNYHALPEAEKSRFLKAVAKMVEPVEPDDPSYFSPFFQIASYNRWPMHFGNNLPKSMMPWCRALWYRAYLHEFEVALQAADISCGGDGKISLPYINVLAHPTVPEQLRQFTFPEEYIRANEELAKVNKRMRSDTAIREALVGLHVHRGMRDEEIDAAATHVLNAYGLKHSEYVAFNPAFYMILAFVDRMYVMHGQSRTQGITPKSPEYWKILVPFRKLPMELVDTRALGYTYEK